MKRYKKALAFGVVGTAVILAVGVLAAIFADAEQDAYGGYYPGPLHHHGI
jgi:hypothetical protein